MPIAALADGMVISPTAFPAHIDIPDQQALIHFTNGTERLVIETRFVGAGTNFAWIIPLPNRPVVEASTTGVFPTLHYLFRPEIQHNVERYYIGLLILVGLVCVLRWVVGCADRVFVLALFILFLLAAAMLVPALSAAGSACSLLSLSAGIRARKAPASRTLSIRFARFGAGSVSPTGEQCVRVRSLFRSEKNSVPHPGHVCFGLGARASMHYIRTP